MIMCFSSPSRLATVTILLIQFWLLIEVLLSPFDHSISFLINYSCKLGNEPQDEGPVMESAFDRLLQVLSLK